MAGDALDLTPEQEIELARGRAAAAKAKPDNSWGGTGKEFLRSAGEGIAGLADLPEQIVTGVRNFPTRMTNAGVTVGGESFTGGVDPAPAPVKLLEPENIYSTAYNQSFPVTPGYERSWTREAGNVAGPTALTLGAGSIPAIVETAGTRGVASALAREVPKVAADTALTTTGTVAGKEGGGAAGQYFGGDTGRQWGESLGGLFGGFTTPILSNIPSRLTTDANTPLRFRNAVTAGVENPDLSLVGSDWASRRGNAANQDLQQRQLDTSLRDLSAERRGTPDNPVPASGPVSETQVGQGVIDLSKTGAKTAATDADTAYRTGFDQLDQNAPITPEALAPFSANAEPTYQQPFIDEYQKAVDASRYKDAATAPRLIDPNAQAGLEANVTLARRELDRLTQARADPAKITAAETDLAKAKGNLDANYGTTFNDVKVRRGDVRSRLDAGEGDTYILNEIHKAQTDAMRQAAIDRGITPEEFDTVNQTYADLKTRQAALEKLAQSKEGPAYSHVFGPGGEKNVSTLQTLQQNADPQALGRILADNLELKARGPSVAGRPELPLDTGLNARAPDWWARLDNNVRDAYFPPGSQQRAKMDATMATMRADARRGGSQGEAPATDLALAAGSAALGHPATAVATMVPRVGSAVFGRLMQSPRFTEAMMARRAQPLQPLDLARTIAAYVGSQQSP